MKPVIEMAREAGFCTLLPSEHIDGTGGVYVGDDDITVNLKRFAARVLLNTPPQSFMSWQDGHEAGRLAEREACAALLEANAMACTNPIHRSLLQANAAEIRARGNV